MKLLQQHELIPINASEDEALRILSQSSFRAIRRTLAYLSGDREKLLRKGRNLAELEDYDLQTVIVTYNKMALTINYNLTQAFAFAKNVAGYIPSILDIDTPQDILDIFSEAEEIDEDDNA